MEYYLGVVRMPSMDRFAVDRGINKLDFSTVNGYARAVLETVRRTKRGPDKVFDPVVTPLLNVHRYWGDIPRVIENFFPDPPFIGSQQWGCLMVCPTNGTVRL